jgi:hypothetical protein
MTEVINHKNIAAALAAAQIRMGKALKTSTNPHFKSKYADLSSVMSACLPSLNSEGIAVVQLPVSGDQGDQSLRTIFMHSETSETVECTIPLIIQKNDMQNLGSALTYARRYGIQCLAGLAAYDDDGNAACMSVKSRPSGSITEVQLRTLRAAAEEKNVPEETICQSENIQTLHELKTKRFDFVLSKLSKCKNKNGAANETA